MLIENLFEIVHLSRTNKIEKNKKRTMINCNRIYLMLIDVIKHIYKHIDFIHFDFMITMKQMRFANSEL